MPIASVKGLIVTLLLVVPGGLGAALRRSAFATQSPTAFTELLHSLAGALIALVAVESTFMVIGGSDAGFGDYLLKPLASPQAFPDDLHWPAYAAFFTSALMLPTVGAWARRRGPFRRVFRAVSPHASGLDYILHEARPRLKRGEEVWATINTIEGEALLGQVAWRSTAPDPLEVVLARVRDLNDPDEAEQQEEWMAWVPGESIRAIWIHVPMNEDEQSGPP